MDKNDLQAIREIIQEELKPIKIQLGKVESQATGNAQMLKSLEEASKVHKAAIDNLTYKFADIEGQIKTINEKLDDLKEVKQVTQVNCYDIAKLKSVK